MGQFRRHLAWYFFFFLMFWVCVCVCVNQEKDKIPHRTVQFSRDRLLELEITMKIYFLEIQRKFGKAIHRLYIEI